MQKINGKISYKTKRGEKMSNELKSDNLKDLTNTINEFDLRSRNYLASDVGSNLRTMEKLLNFIENNEYISLYLKRMNEMNENKVYDVRSDVKEMVEAMNASEKMLPIPKTFNAEMSYTYQFMKCIVNDELNFMEFTFMYGGYYSKYLKDHIRKFNELVIEPFLDEIGIELEKEYVNMKSEQPFTEINIQNNAPGNQIIGKMSGEAKAVYNNQGNPEIDKIIETIASLIGAVEQNQEINEEEKVDVQESLNEIMQQLQENGRPKRATLKGFRDAILTPYIVNQIPAFTPLVQTLQNLF